MTPFDVASLSEYWRYTSFSASDKPGRLWIEIEICSQKVLQFTMFPSNLGTSNLGSLTPLPPSEGRVESREQPDGNSNLLILESSQTAHYQVVFARYRAHQIPLHQETEECYRRLPIQPWDREVALHIEEEDKYHQALQTRTQFLRLQ